MSAPGISLISPDNPIPSLPGAVPVVKPQNASGTPPVPAANAPNVASGQQNVNTDTSAIQALMQAKIAEMNAGQAALTANTSVDTSTAQHVAGYQADILKSYGNLQKSEQLPGGADGGLARIIGLFDSDYNKSYQTTSIQENTLKSEMVSATAAAIKEKNNLLPALAGKISEATQSIFNAQTQANELVLKQGQLEVERSKAAMEAIETRIHMSAEARSAADFKIRSMSTDQIEAALPMAQAGKGPFKGMAGLLQERLTSEKSAETNLGIASVALAKGSREEAHNAQVAAIGSIPTDITSGMIADAQKNNMPYISMPTGQKDAKGQPIVQQIPLVTAQEGVVKARETEQADNAGAAANIMQRTNIPARLTNNFNVSNAFSSMDPRSSQLQTQLGMIMKNLDPSNPSNVSVTNSLLDNWEKARDDMVKDNAAKFSTPGAKAAVLAYGKTGTFDSVGGSNVVADSISNPALRNNSIYKNVWSMLGQKLAAAIVHQHTVNTGALDPNNPADAQQILAQAFQKTDGKEKLNALSQEILADPANQRAMSSGVKNVITANGLNAVIHGLAQQKDANPIWDQLDKHPEMMLEQTERDSKGKLTGRAQFSASKLFDNLEQASVLSHGKINFGGAFLQAYKTYLSNVDNSPSSDPSYGVQDHALEASLYNSTPHATILASSFGQYQRIAAQKHEEMRARIKQDITGQTQQQAVQQEAIKNTGQNMYFGPMGLDSENVRHDIQKKTGLDVNQVPSASGTSLTAAQIKAIFPGGY